MKFAAGITLYNPNYDMIQNLIRTAKLFDVLYVYDNTECKVDYLDAMSNVNNLVYLGRGENDGLPVAFNEILNKALDDKIDYLCTLDQDSVLSKSNVTTVEQYIKDNNMENVAAVAPFPTGTKRKNKREIEDVKWVICSGCFLNLKILDSYNICYDEAYFVDRFDADICAQMKKKKLKIIRLNNVILKHVCGDGNGKHSELRHYYMFRNRYYYNDKYYCRFLSVIRTLLQNIRHFRWVYSSDKDIEYRKKIYELAKKDYKMGKMGKISNDSYKQILNR